MLPWSGPAVEGATTCGMGALREACVSTGANRGGRGAGRVATSKAMPLITPKPTSAAPMAIRNGVRTIFCLDFAPMICFVNAGPLKVHESQQ